MADDLSFKLMEQHSIHSNNNQYSLQYYFWQLLTLLQWLTFFEKEPTLKLTSQAL